MANTQLTTPDREALERSIREIGTDLASAFPSAPGIR